MELVTKLEKARNILFETRINETLPRGFPCSSEITTEAIEDANTNKMKRRLSLSKERQD